MSVELYTYYKYRYYYQCDEYRKGGGGGGRDLIYKIQGVWLDRCWKYMYNNVCIYSSYIVPLTLYFNLMMAS